MTTDQDQREAGRKEMKMSENKHTPGPWSYDIHGVITGGTHLATSVCVTSQHKWERAEGLGTWLEDQHRRELVSECRANARLIAAAPELLEALKMVVRHGSAVQHSDQLMFEVLSAARAAIAKAEGGSNKTLSDQVNRHEKTLNRRITG